MPDDRWAEIFVRLTNALEEAFEFGFTEEEIEDAIANARPSDVPYVPGPPKKERREG